MTEGAVGTSSSLVVVILLGTGVGTDGISLGLNGLSVLVMVGGAGVLGSLDCWGTLFTGLNLLLGNPEPVVSESLLSSFPIGRRNRSLG